eukprot:m.206600 g.206600  ORF g.206600 m.206600 type:complete len:105 (-) comp17106_c0_seq2:414-728(-)
MITHPFQDEGSFQVHSSIGLFGQCLQRASRGHDVDLEGLRYLRDPMRQQKQQQRLPPVPVGLQQPKEKGNRVMSAVEQAVDVNRFVLPVEACAAGWPLSLDTAR